MIEPEQGTTTFSFLINLDSIEISQDQWDRVEGKGEEIKISTTLMMNFVKKENEEWEGRGGDRCVKFKSRVRMFTSMVT